MFVLVCLVSVLYRCSRLYVTDKADSWACVQKRWTGMWICVRFKCAEDDVTSEWENRGAHHRCRVCNAIKSHVANVFNGKTAIQTPEYIWDFRVIHDNLHNFSYSGSMQHQLCLANSSHILHNHFYVWRIQHSDSHTQKSLIKEILKDIIRMFIRHLPKHFPSYKNKF